MAVIAFPDFAHASCALATVQLSIAHREPVAMEEAGGLNAWSMV